MSFSTLNIAASGLTAAQRAVEIAAHNISNSAVPGYTRQRAGLAAAPAVPGTPGLAGSGMRGTGVQVVSIERLRSQIGDLAVRAEAGTAGSTGARAAVLDRAQGILGPYGEGVPKALSDLWGAFGNLATSPSSPAARQAVLDKAASVAGGLNDAASELEQIRADTTSQFTDGVAEANALLRQVAGLNQSVADAVSAGQAPNDLLDTRDLALDRLAELTGSTVVAQANGVVEVRIGSEPVVTGNTAVELVAGSAPPPAGYVGADPVLQIGTGSSARTVLSGGVLGGQVATASTDLRDVERRLNEFATAVRDVVNTQHQAGFDLSGAAGGPVFSGTGARDLAVDPALTANRIAASGGSVAGGNPLDGENAVALAGLGSAAGGGAALDERVVGLATLLGSRAAQALRAAETADTAFSGRIEARSAENGVSIDEEMVDLVKYQKAFDAAGRVISIADGMLDTIINRMGAGR